QFLFLYILTYIIYRIERLCLLSIKGLLVVTFVIMTLSMIFADTLVSVPVTAQSPNLNWERKCLREGDTIGLKQPCMLYTYRTLENESLASHNNSFEVYP